MSDNKKSPPTQPLHREPGRTRDGDMQKSHIDPGRVNTRRDIAPNQPISRDTTPNPPKK